MKKTRKLIPALAMLLISAVMMSTASFAWFSMNKQVTATGMTIQAQSDNVWLVINEGSTFNPSYKLKDASSTASAKSLYPVAPAITLTSANVTAPASWHFAYSDATNTSTAAGGYQDCSTLDGYVASETFSIGLSKISGADTAPNLRLTAVDLPDNSGISVVVVCGTNAYNHEADASGITDNKLADEVTKTGVVVTVYYYINGDDANVYVDNIAALTGKVTLSFDVGTVATP